MQLVTEFQQCVKQKLIELKGEGNTRNDGWRGQQYSPVITRIHRQGISRTSSRGTEDLSNTMNHLDLSDVYRMPHPTAGEHTFLSGAPGGLYGVT